MSSPIYPRLLVLGAGGHGLVIGDCAQAAGLACEIVFFDDRWPQLTQCGPWPVIGNSRDLIAQFQSGDAAFVAIGDNRQREEHLNRLASAGVQLATLVHPRAVLSALANLGEGTFVAAGAVINAAARTGRGCIINTGATIDHHAVLGDAVHVAPGANLGGNVNLGARALVGIGAAVRPAIEIGADAIIAAGAVVVSSVPSGATFAGVPARALRSRS